MGRSTLTDQVRRIVRDELAAGDLTQAELAERMGLPAETLNRFLRATRTIRTDTLDTIAEALRLQVVQGQSGRSRKERKEKNRG